jgi:peptidoglycan/xylan/chitin deacetylase (PgdA/CDA1 family)
VADSRTIDGYGKNVDGERQAIPRLLEIFRKYGVKATWATVGMIMCKDYLHWRDLRPSALPSYRKTRCSTYSFDADVREYPRLFFARPLVEQILSSPGQELATHTYSHFYCAEPGATLPQFEADLSAAVVVASTMGVTYKSIVFPRNQVLDDFLPAVKRAGIKVYRGNPRHPLYREGHTTPCGVAGRAVRFADSWLPLTGARVSVAENHQELVNVPASFFLRPCSPRFAALEPLRLHRIKAAMTRAAETNGICHIWWHPHNFGTNTDENIHALDQILQHYRWLRDGYGMNSSRMADFASEKIG